MREQLAYIFSVSRPKFWLYTLGPFLIGIASAIYSQKSFENISWNIFLFGILYLIPANIFIYGVNDLFDEDTDAFNDKKTGDEVRLARNKKRLVATWVLLSFIVLGAAVFFMNIAAAAYGFLFILLGYGYSAPPIRFKAKPFVDFISNILYAMPGFVSYALITGKEPDIFLICAAGCWTGAMHLYSAIPDIESDAKAHLRTTAVLLGVKRSLWLCASLWFLSGLFVYLFSSSFLIAMILGSGYSLLMLWCVDKKYTRDNLMRVYKKFPLINAAVGFILFWTIILLADLSFPMP